MSEQKQDPAQEKEEWVQLKKRPDYLSWDDYFMAVAYLSEFRVGVPSPVLLS